MWIPKWQRDRQKGVDSPVPTQVVSNEEFIPRPQNAQQKQVEYLINDSRTKVIFVEDDEQANHEATHIAHIAAAQYYEQRTAISCPPKELRHHTGDIHDLIDARARKGAADPDVNEEQHELSAGR